MCSFSYEKDDLSYAAAASSTPRSRSAWLKLKCVPGRRPGQFGRVGAAGLARPAVACPMLPRQVDECSAQARFARAGFCHDKVPTVYES